MIIIPKNQTQPLTIAFARLPALDGDGRFLPLGVKTVRCKRMQPVPGIVRSAMAGQVVTDRSDILCRADGAVSVAVNARCVDTDTTGHAQKAKVYAGGLAWNGPHGIEGTRENYPLFDVVNAKNVVTGIGKNGLVEIDKEKILK